MAVSFCWWKKPEYLEKISDLSQVTDPLDTSLIASEWLFFQLYHGENKFIFNEMMMKSILY